MGQMRVARFAVIGGVGGPCARTCSAPCVHVCALIFNSFEISRRDNYTHDSFINIQHYIRNKGEGGLMDRTVPELAASTLPGGSSM